jgi:hypothetical protein
LNRRAATRFALATVATSLHSAVLHIGHGTARQSGKRRDPRDDSEQIDQQETADRQCEQPQGRWWTKPEFSVAQNRFRESIGAM